MSFHCMLLGRGSGGFLDLLPRNAIFDCSLTGQSIRLRNVQSEHLFTLLGRLGVTAVLPLQPAL